jgi:hypothetical protein
MPVDALWTLPVPSTALLEDVKLEKRLGREVALRFAYEADEDGTRATSALLFEGVEAFKCTYYRACDGTMLEAYDALVDRGSTQWLNQIRANLAHNAGNADGLRHLMITFDDGPAYEFVCRSFHVDD